MSGTSLDGLDLVCVKFNESNNKWDFEIEAVEHVAYSKIWKHKLSRAYYADDLKLNKLDKEYGFYIAKKTLKFIQKNKLHPCLIASHGHTVRHNPDEGITLQIGDGQTIAQTTMIETVNDFRSEDVRRGGQGAPLVPIGDKLLFSEYPLCLNIGGIANVSFDLNGKRIAFDICIANQALNYLAQSVGYDFDENGDLASFGTVSNDLLLQLQHPYYEMKYPKSLGREFFETVQCPIFEAMEISAEDALATYVEHIAQQIALATNQLPPSEMLLSGGGAFNTFLVSRIQTYSKHQLVIPETKIIAYKEAIVFAFLGLCRKQNKINVLSSVTGASSDSCSGVVWYPKVGLFET